MSEEIKLLPCPHCGGTDLQIDWNGVYERHFVRCYNYDCHMQGPEVYGRSNAAKAWNALPRALVWTNEAPKVPGRYYGWTGKKDAPIQIWVVFEYKTPKKGLVRMKTKPYWDRNREVIRCHTVEQYELQWAGPIPEPKKEETC